MRPGSARVVVERDSSLLFLAAGATVDVNGRRIATLGRGGSATTDIPAGHVNVKVKANSAPGQFVVGFDAVAGKTYRFVVSPKSDALLLGSAFGLIGDAVHATISDTSGYFQIEMVETLGCAQPSRIQIAARKGHSHSSGKGRKGAVV